eukprot:scaffold870_cov393-Prasinococcus_capsulatus_cf.AAC.11
MPATSLSPVICHDSQSGTGGRHPGRRKGEPGDAVHRGPAAAPSVAVHSSGQVRMPALTSCRS